MTEQPSHREASYREASDLDLLNRLQAGDEAALVTLHTRHASTVYAVAYRVLGEQMSAEEVTQDTFLRLWQKGHSFDPARGAFLPWLLTITRRRAIDRLRQRGREIGARADTFSLDEEPYLAEQIAGNEPDREQRELRQALVMALHELPAEQQQALALAYFSGMTHSDIAAHLELPLGTVKTRIRLGMQKLREIWFSGDNPKPGEAA
ncbi:MAG: sigma-70 family RNA polymerase sigma factor [Anaerolineae bacterium]|nr:sigma-70 family RNA polymerase sigma factor [Anaerolineae bacterium]